MLENHEEAGRELVRTLVHRGYPDLVILRLLEISESPRCTDEPDILT